MAFYSHQSNSMILNYIKQQIHLILSNLTISWFHFLQLSVCFKLLLNSFKFWGFWTNNKRAEPQGKKSILQLQKVIIVFEIKNEFKRNWLSHLVFKQL
jgi:hypothetical protein